jgi:hypothetical protein
MYWLCKRNHGVSSSSIVIAYLCCFHLLLLTKAEGILSDNLDRLQVELIYGLQSASSIYSVVRQGCKMV